MSKAALGIVISVVLMAPVAAWLNRSGNAGAIGRDQVAQQFVMPRDCRPEPGERAAFMVCALGLPALIFAWATLGRKIGSSVTDEVAPSRRDDLVGLALVLMAAAAAWFGVRAEGNNALLMNGFARDSRQAAALFGLSAVIFWWGRRGGSWARVAANSAAVVAILGTACARIYDERADLAWGNHFEAVYHPLVQVVLGKTVLANMTSQYGLFPHFLAPIFSVIGLSVLKFTIVLAVLTAAVMAALWAVLRGATQNRMVALAGLLAIIANLSFTIVESHDLYFQYMPIRMVAPAASLWLTWRYLACPSRRRYWATTLALGLGLLWNLDTGVPALASWMAVLSFGELAATGTIRRKAARIAGHLGAGGLGAAAAATGYSVLVLLRAGRLPDFVSFLEFQRIFYGAGFYMLPMPAMGAWWAVVLIYLAALSYAANALVRGRVTPRTAILFHLATLGIGLFAYYQGRSHPRVLSLVWWPAFLIATLFLDEILADARRVRVRLSRVAAASVLMWIVAGSAWSLWERGPFLRQWFGRHLVAAMKRGPAPSSPDVAAIKRAMRRGERVLTVSGNESLLSARLGHPSAWRSSLVEALLVEDFRAMGRRVARGEFDRIWVDTAILYSLTGENRGVAELDGLLRRGTIVEPTPHGVLLNPNTPPNADRAALPPIAAPVRLHAVYAGGKFATKLPAPALTLGRTFTIEAIVRPDRDQPPSATLVGNHPGQPNPIAGFTVQQDGTRDNHYVLYVGDGRTFHLLSTFALQPDRWTCLTITVGEDATSTFLDGRLVETRPRPEALTILDSRLPVTIGDWYHRTRTFRGRIAEVRLSDEVLGGDEALRRWVQVRREIEQIAARDGGVKR
ncbi:MAG: hypothetical protein JWN86_1105 [Planctomycetota bacterium]|nr:hypothetical protein [Planctomycetota bacterium]